MDERGVNKATSGKYADQRSVYNEVGAIYAARATGTGQRVGGLPLLSVRVRTDRRRQVLLHGRLRSQQGHRPHRLR